MFEKTLKKAGTKVKERGGVGKENLMKGNPVDERAEPVRCARGGSLPCSLRGLLAGREPSYAPRLGLNMEGWKG